MDLSIIPFVFSSTTPAVAKMMLHGQGPTPEEMLVKEPGEKAGISPWKTNGLVTGNIGDLFPEMMPAEPDCAGPFQKECIGCQA
jgi:hypothetical protein